MNISINISAPELVDALNNLAGSIGNVSAPATKSTSKRSGTKEKEPATTATCNDCNSFTPDQVLTSVGKCNAPEVATVNGFVAVDQAQTCNQAPIQQPTQPVLQPVLQPAAPPPMPQAVPTQIPVQQAPVQQQPQYQQPPIQVPVQQQPQQPVQQYQQPPVQQQAVPTTPQTYSLDQIAVAAAQYIDMNPAANRQAVANLLAQFGVPTLTALPKERFGEFATQLRTMGANL
jgi:hypothetical protein